MTCSFKLSLPRDIPWERVCVTRDMLDSTVCDSSGPPKWHSSIVVFKYVPEDEYQQYPDYKISYLKIATTITGYQPKDAEVDGEINWDGLNVETIEEVEALLNQYLPCTGAILQVTVGPSETQKKIPSEQYPFFMDFEPKKRNLYEMATDTKERVSRSLESLGVNKSAGSLESLEVLDIDMGSSSSFGMNASYLGTGGGFSSSSSVAGQWGTKSVGAHQSEVIRTTDQSREKREGQSHTTQLSQMYHLFDSYHLGTNRAVFFVQPRPHVLEEATGIVRGPRQIDGIQEIFLVVAQPKNQKDFCVSVKLDTAHLTEIDILAYDRSKSDTASASVSVSVPANKNDGSADSPCTQGVYEPIFGNQVGTRHFVCRKKNTTVNEDYTPPWSDYKIDVSNNGGYSIASRGTSHGSAYATVWSNANGLTLTCTANSHKCFFEGSDGIPCLSNCKTEMQVWSGYANIEVIVNLISKEPIIKVGTDEVVVITTRGLCCCTGIQSKRKYGKIDAKKLADTLKFEKEVVKEVVPVSKLYQKTLDTGARGEDIPETPSIKTSPAAPQGEKIKETLAIGTWPTPEKPSPRPDGTDSPSASKNLMSIRRANEKSDLIRKELLASMSPSRSVNKQPKPYVKTNLFAQQLERRLKQKGFGRNLLNRNTKKKSLKGLEKKLEKHFNQKAGTIKNAEIARISNEELARITDLKIEDATKLRLSSLGIVFKKSRKVTKGENRELWTRERVKEENK